MLPSGTTRLPVFPVVVYILVAVNIMVFGCELAAPDTDAYIDALAVIPFNITHHIALPWPSPPYPEFTIVTSTFLHESVLHIVSNMLFLIAFGPPIEYLCGHGRFLVLYLLCGAVGGLATIATGPASHVPQIGASGAIAGVLGAYIVMYPYQDLKTIVPSGCLPQSFRLPASLIIAVWAAVQFLHGWGVLRDKVSIQPGGTAYFAHIGGFGAGVVLIGFFCIRAPRFRGYRFYW